MQQKNISSAPATPSPTPLSCQISWFTRFVCDVNSDKARMDGKQEGQDLRAVNETSPRVWLHPASSIDCTCQNLGDMLTDTYITVDDWHVYFSIGPDQAGVLKWMWEVDVWLTWISKQNKSARQTCPHTQIPREWITCSKSIPAKHKRNACLLHNYRNQGMVDVIQKNKQLNTISSGSG